MAQIRHALRWTLLLVAGAAVLAGTARYEGHVGVSTPSTHVIAGTSDPPGPNSMTG